MVQCSGERAEEALAEAGCEACTAEGGPGMVRQAQREVNSVSVARQVDEPLLQRQKQQSTRGHV